MSYRLTYEETVQEGVRRIVGEQIDQAAAELDDNDLDQTTTIHQVRKRCKKIRAVLRLVRPTVGETYARENARYRDAAKRLSTMRDAGAMIETYDDLIKQFIDMVEPGAFKSLRDHLENRKSVAMSESVGIEQKLETFVEALHEGRERLADWALSDAGFYAVAGGVNKTYQRGRNAMAAAYETHSKEAFHEWRKRAKYHWYHMRLLCDIWPPVMKARRDEVDRLGKLLGDHHNLHVLRDLLAGDANRIGNADELSAFTGLIDRRLTEIEAVCQPLGQCVFVEKPKHLVRRLGAYWESAGYQA